MLAKTPLRDQMIAWLETKDPNKTYDYRFPSDCACGQFARAAGRTDEWWSAFLTSGISAWKELDHIAGSGKRTFGALRKRLSQ